MINDDDRPICPHCSQPIVDKNDQPLFTKTAVYGHSPDTFQFLLCANCRAVISVFPAQWPPNMA